jgi:cytochrome bd ubiquinol oxidase subunit II
MDILPLAWACIIAFCIVMYVILDGFTLGAGMLMPFLNAQERDLAMSVLLPSWDGNQTWLVLGGASLYGAFPLAFSVLLPKFYLPIFLMVIALLFRGVVFEFRLKAAPPGRKIWDGIFAGASFIVTMIQGVVLGNFISGFKADTGVLVPFTLFTGVGLIFGYCLLGATRLILKTTGSLPEKMTRCAYITLAGVAIGMVIASLWTPQLSPQIFERWFGESHWIELMILPYISAITGGILLWGLYKREEILPFWCAVVLFLCAYVGFAISIYPYIIPFQTTFWQAAAPDSSLRFLLFGVIIMLPILLLYTGYSYHIFKGKTKNVFEY